MKKIITLCLVALLVILTACVAQAALDLAGSSQLEKHTPNEKRLGDLQPSEPAPASTLPPPEGPSDLTYVNETLGFQLSIPETWTDFQATEMHNDKMTSICFTFAGHQPICVLQIDVYHKPVWSGLKKVPEGYYLAENDRFVFAAGPYPAECIQLDEFQCQRYQEVPVILARFSME